VVTAFTPFEVRVRAILFEHPEMPATVIAERVGWPGSITWFRNNVRRLRPDCRRPDPADRLVWQSGDAAQCDLWFPPKRVPLEDGSRALLPVLVIVAAYSRLHVRRHRRRRLNPHLAPRPGRMIQQTGPNLGHLILIRRAAADATRARRHDSLTAWQQRPRAFYDDQIGVADGRDWFPCIAGPAGAP
jgi:hypothetical protein